MNAQYPHDLLARLQAAETAEERGWLVTQALLDSLPPDLRPAADCASLYVELQNLSFVEPFEARGGTTSTR